MKKLTIPKRAAQDLGGIERVGTMFEKEEDPYNQVAPGLYPDEKAYELDSGHRVAASVAFKRLPESAESGVIGWVRWIDADGSTMRDSNGNPVEIEHRQGIDAGALLEHDADWYCAQVLQLLLGLPTDNGWDDHTKNSKNINLAIKAAEATASPDPDDLLPI